MSACPSLSELRDFHLGNLPPDHVDRVAEHLDRCLHCERRLAEMESAADELLKVVREHAHEQATRVMQVAGDLRVSPGTRIGNYEVIEEVGHGGMGLVCKALHLTLNRVVAMKFLNRVDFGDSGQLERFRFEAEITARLRHPNIVQIHEIGDWEIEAGLAVPFIALEFIEGGSLSRKTGRRPQPPLIVIDWMLQLASAVTYAHEQGVIHRDLKPSNILVDDREVLKLCDFGVARELEGKALRTQTGMIIGTPEYMAPEQAAGLTHLVGKSSDIWAMGAILYELLTGRPPFAAADYLLLLQQIRHDDPVAPRQLQPAISKDLETVCLKCLSKNPRQRYETAAEFADDLLRVREGRPVKARRVGLIEQSFKWVRRHPAIAIAMAFVGFLATVVLPGVTALWLKSDVARQEADLSLEQAETALYFNQIALARQGLETEGIDQALLMLDRCRPKYGQADRRNWEWRYLYRLSQLGFYAGLKHESPDWSWINDVVWSHDGRFLVTVGGPVEDPGVGQIRIWNTSDWTLFSSIDTPDGAVRSVVVNPVTQKVLTAGVDGDVSEWDVMLKSQSPVVIYKGRDEDPRINRIHCSTDGRWLAIGFENGLSLLDLQTGVDRRLAEAAWPGIIDLDWRETQEVSGRAVSLLTAICPPDELQRSVLTWDCTDPANPIQRDSAPQAAPWNRVAIDPGSGRGRVVCADEWLGDVGLLDAADGRLVDRLSGHRGGILDLKFSSEGVLASAGVDGTVRLWDLPGRREIAVLRGHSDGVRAVAFSPDEKQIASVGQDLRIRIWDVGQDSRGRSFEGTRRGWGEFSGGLAFSPDSQQIVCVSHSDQTIVGLNIQTGEDVFVHDMPIQRSFGSVRNDQALRSDGSQFAGPDPNEPAVINIWNTADAANVVQLRGHIVRPHGIAWSGDGRFLASVSIADTSAGQTESTVIVWDAVSGRLLSQWGCGDLPATELAITENGRYVAVAVERGPGVTGLPAESLVEVREAMTGTVVHQLQGVEGRIADLCFRPDGGQLAAIGIESLVLATWDLDPTHRRIVRPTFMTPTGVAYTPDGCRIAVGCYDNKVRIWDSRSENEAISLLCRGNPGTGNYGFKSWVTFSHDGTRLAATDWQGRITVWEAPAAE